MAQEANIRQQEFDQKRQFWKTHIASWQAGQLSQTEYCRRHELKFHQFVYLTCPPKTGPDFVREIWHNLGPTSGGGYESEAVHYGEDYRDAA